jgi:hypothetical protein
VDRSPRFIQTLPCQVAGAPQMFVRFLATATRHGVLQRFQLHDHTSKTLRERIVDVSRQSISFV